MRSDGSSSSNLTVSTETPPLTSSPPSVLLNVTTAVNSSDIHLLTTPEALIDANAIDLSNSTWNSVTGDPDDDDTLPLSLPVIIGIAIGAFTLLMIFGKCSHVLPGFPMCSFFPLKVVVVAAMYHRNRRKLPTGKLNMGPRHTVQPEQYPGLFDDRDDIVSLSYINVHMHQPKVSSLFSCL
jgi:hypothetical protein